MRLSIPAILVLAASIVAAADTVTLRSGTKVNGTVVRDDREQVIIQDARGKFHTFERADVAKVESNELGKKKPETKPAKTDDPGPESGGATPADRPAKAPEADQEAAAPALTEVLATGVGKDADAARKDALRQAVSQVVGSLVIASDAVANDELIDSKILTYSDGYVEKWEPVGEPAARDGMVRAKIRAWVRQGKLTKALIENNVPVKEVNLRDMQGKSDTTAQQSRSAGEVVAALFEGFPAKVLAAEAMSPTRVSGDESGTVFEVPVRIKVDMAKWKAFVAEAKRVLDPIAEAKGTEAWNTKMAGWYPMVGARNNSKPKPQQGRAESDAAPEPGSVVDARDSFWLTRFVLGSDRASASVYFDEWKSAPCVNTPRIGTERKRVLAILDSMGGKLAWWQLPAEAWSRLLGRTPAMRLHVAISDAEGDSIATVVQDWSEYIEASRPGESDREVFDRDAKVGSDLLMVGFQHEYAKTGWHMGCSLVVSPEGSLNQAGNDFLRMCVPAALGSDSQVTFLSPAIVLPRRFRIPGELANLAADSKVVVEFVDP